MTASEPGAGNVAGLAPRRVHSLWRLELLQVARGRYLSSIMAVAVIVTTLALTAASGLLNSSVDPADLGSVLFQVLYSNAVFFAICGGAVWGALAISRDRESAALDIILLAPLGARSIAWSKYRAAYCRLGLWLALFLPLGAVPFVCGGTTLAEAALAWLGVAICAAPSVALGMFLGASVIHPKHALPLALGWAVLLASGFLAVAGLGGAQVAHQLWPEVTSALPIWLPVVLTRAALDWPSAVSILVIPLLGSLLLTWLYLELTIRGIDPARGRPERGLQRWAYACAVCCIGLALLASYWIAARDQQWMAFAGGIGVSLALAWFLLLSFVDSPSRAGQRGRLTGPSTRGLLGWVLGFGYSVASVLFVLGGVQAWQNRIRLGDSVYPSLLAIAVVALAGAAFLLFQTGFLALLWRWGVNPRRAKKLLCAAALVAWVLPWGVVVSGLGSRVFALFAVVAASPAYAPVAAFQLAEIAAQGGLEFGDWTLLLPLCGDALHALAGALFWWLAVRKPRASNKEGGA
ncbi:MAG TPA: hypothetical protein VHM70_02630 [Polyangiaceae bacterium]|nr:hypothetical protein [Polyangiaceae bacterium]